MEQEEIQIVIITGMSGAGKTVAVQSMEDLGYFCVDNLPPALIPKFIELIDHAKGKMNKVAFVSDLRGRSFFDELFKAIDQIDQTPDRNLHVQTVFLEAEDAVLVQRYKETRRSHPLAKSGSLLEGIKREREMLAEIRGYVQQIIDTTHLRPVQLREKITQLFNEKDRDIFSLQFVSFGFKYGVPIDIDLVFDVRFLPNPHYIEQMRPKSGLDEEVSSYVLKWKETQQFLEKLTDLLTYIIPHYKREGKSQVVIGIGCTGGKHRSVTIARYLAKYYENEYVVHTTHRDQDKWKG